MRATFDRDFSDSLLRAIVRRRRIRGGSGELVGAHTRDFRQAWTAARSNLEPSPQQTDQCFTVINYGNDFVLKLYRKLEEGINPGREVPEFLCEHTRSRHFRAALGSLEYRRYLGRARRAKPASARSAVRCRTRPSAGTTRSIIWACSSNTRWRFRRTIRASAILVRPISGRRAIPAPQIIAELLGNYLDSIRVLARRTGRAAHRSEQPFRYSRLRARAVHHVLPAERLSRHAGTTESHLRVAALPRTRSLPQEAQAEISEVLNREGEIRSQLLALRDKRMSGTRIRNHGDYHLSNVLFSGSDWVHHQLRRRSRPSAERAPHQALGLARRGHHAALVSLRFACCAVRRRSGHRAQPRGAPATGEAGRASGITGSARSSSRNTCSAAGRDRSCRSRPMRSRSCWAPT